MKQITLYLIRLYQKTLSPDHGLLKYKYPYGFCRLYPSCSEYSYESVKKHGIILATPLIIKRLVKCNPFTEPQIHKP